MSAADPTAALADYLIEKVGSLVAGRVYRPQLPSDVDPLVTACIVVTPNGGYTMLGGSSTVGLGDPRLRIVCYGTNEMQAQNIAREAHLALKAMTRQVREGVLIHSVNLVSGPLPLVHPTLHWMACVLHVQVLHAEQAIA